MSRILQVAVAVLAISTAASAQGIIAPTAGPINSAMAGASVAAPVTHRSHEGQATTS